MFISGMNKYQKENMMQNDNIQTTIVVYFVSMCVQGKCRSFE